MIKLTGEIKTGRSLTKLNVLLLHGSNGSRGLFLNPGETERHTGHFLSDITVLPCDNEVKQFPQNLMELLIFL